VITQPDYSTAQLLPFSHKLPIIWMAEKSEVGMESDRLVLHGGNVLNVRKVFRRGQSSS
jgi:hypothetical protein